jgi:phosphoglucosamine mutase
MFPDEMANITKLERADLGIALDGDADRVIFSDENGDVIHGDQIIAVLAKEMKRNNELNDDKVVGTLMSNLGLENFLRDLNINLHRTKVGDRYILDEMIKSNSKLGGEPSGHILLTDFAKTGDGLLTAIKILSLLKKSGMKASEFLRPFKLVPQSLKNLKNINKEILSNETITKLVYEKQKMLGKNGRILLRPSGTEDLIRIMVECENKDTVADVTNNIADKIMEQNDILKNK